MDPNASTGDLNGPDGQGEGQETEPTDYAGFENPSDLASAYQEATAKQESLEKQIADLERIKGTQGNEIGQMRQQLATLSGQIEGMKTSSQQNQAQQGPTLDQINAAWENGDITEQQALAYAVKATEQNVRNALTKSYKDDLKRELESFKAEIASQEYQREFLAKNPGYAEAYDSGKLDQWLSIDPVTGEKSGGENAWKEYQLHAAKAELKELKEKANQNKTEAEKAGLDKGLELAKSKTNAGKVLDGKGGKFTQTSGNYDLTRPGDRRAAALAHLQRMRQPG
jgi:hypothetical protein